VREETARSKEAFVSHFQAKYGDCHPCLPVWEAAEVMTMGTLLTFYRGSPHRVKKAVASYFGVPDEVLHSWLLTLNAIRNICAHHGRLWNRTLGVKPFIPRAAQYPDWHYPVEIGNAKAFGVLTICRHCLGKVAPQSGWPQRLAALLAEFPSIPLAEMGFPANWKDSPLWLRK
jgi:abortive infection bacteriophage resistance protein